MAVFAIADLHMSGGQTKPMNVFGKHWDNHVSRIIDNWKRTVTSDDLVLVPGDISWAMHFDQAKTDLLTIAGLPGTKVILRGNHDYWWASIGKIRSWLPDSVVALQNDSFVWQDHIVCGTRGWLFPTEISPLEDSDEKIFQRELIRLELSLQSASKQNGKRIAMLHFPPLLKDFRDTAFTAMLEQYSVSVCCYGHLHDTGIANGFNGVHNDIEYHLISCDSIEFNPKLILQ